MKYWLAAGPLDNWEIGIKKTSWAISERLRNSWSRLEKGDRLFFYVTAPIKGLVGFGTVVRTKTETVPFWPQEVSEDRVIWPLRIEFQVDKAILRTDWGVRCVRPGRKDLNPFACFQRVDEDRAREWMAFIERATRRS
jgi:hypothetical protein